MKIDVNNDGKADFSISVPQIITIVSLIVSLAGTYYTLKNRIDQLEIKVQRAEELPPQEVKQKDLQNLQNEFLLRIEKVAVQAKENMDEIKAFEKEVRNNYKRNR